LEHSHDVALSIECEEGDRGLALHGLLHDAAECILGDIPGPLKALLGVRVKLLERELQKQILRHLGIKPPTFAERAIVKTYDHADLLIELRHATHPRWLRWMAQNPAQAVASHARFEVTADDFITYYEELRND